MRRATAGAALAAAVWTMAPAPAHAMCQAGKSAPCWNAQGCSGERTCSASGHMGGCVIDKSTCPAPPPSDHFTVQSSPSGSVGICVDGLKVAGGEVDDQRLTLGGTLTNRTFNVGNLTASSLGNEVIAFARGRAPTLTATPWTNTLETFQSPIAATIRVPITVWIVTAPNTFAVQALGAFSTVIQMGALFDSERLGLDWSLIEVRDATTDPQAATFANTTDLGQLESDIGHVAGRINVYWVPAVNGGSGNGLGEVAHGDSVAVGQNAAAGLLAHEIGHNLALDHIDGDARFDGSNIMMSNGGTRLFLTEGQAFRAHIRTISAIRSTAVYNLRAGMPFRDHCNLTTTSRDCPRADMRIWADGAAFPAN